MGCAAPCHFLCTIFQLMAKKKLEATSRVDTGHILGPNSHMTIAILVGLLLRLTMEIWDRERGPFRLISTVFAILGHVGNAISPWGKEPSQEGVAILVAWDRGSIAQEVRICSSGLAGVMQLTAHATLPNFAFLAVFCPVARPSPRGTASSQRDSKPNPDAQNQRGYQGPGSRLGLTK